MLPENCSGFKWDDLRENAIDMEDGGDGVFSGTDYFLFYAPGPDSWIKDSVHRSFTHQKNIYSDQSFYFLTVGGQNKTIPTIAPVGSPNITINTYDYRYFHELDTVNFLSSGKEWYGEEFTNSPGKQTSWQFVVTIPDPDLSAPVTLVSSTMARSVGTGSSFSVTNNGTAVLEQDIPPVGSGNYDQFGKALQSAAAFTIAQAGQIINYTFAPGSFNAQGWLNWFELAARAHLSLATVSQLPFRDWKSTGAGNTGSFTLANAAGNTQVWDVTDPQLPIRIQGSQNGTDYHFVNDCRSLHEYIAFNGAHFPTPVAIGKIASQNLHQAVAADLLIITHPSFLAQAQALAGFHHQHDHLNVVTVTTDQVYNEFSSGTPDPTAVRDYAKMYFDRSGNDSTKRPGYLLLFGAGSYDYKDRLSNNTNLVPAYETAISIDPLNTYTSDDFFGLLNNTDDINSTTVTSLLDIGIGRIPARNAAEAKAVLDKILHYADPKTQGAWRNQLDFIADDEDQNLHFNDAETFTNTASSTGPVFNIDKIYLDAYKKVSTPAGGRYPDVNTAILNRLSSGVLVWNYNGHGSNSRLAEEDIFDQSVINTLTNSDKLPLFITATCDFAPFDNPLVNSIGANLLVRPATGAIALMTTTRLVFAFSNKTINNNYIAVALQPRSDSSYRSLGEAVKLAKNITYQSPGDVINNRKFTLIGDPALTLAFPYYKVKTTAINGKPLSNIPDTLKALNQYSVSGVISDLSGTTITGFNGTVNAEVFDKPQTQTTLANDPDSYKAPFKVQNNALYKGKVQVINGSFSFSFIVPRDINYQYGNGKMSYYAADGQKDGNGAFTAFIIGGTGGSINDHEGPSLKAYLNDEHFVNGGITNQTPILIVKLVDSSGINILGTGIGHDITAILDNDQNNPYKLNDFYEADLNSFQRGTVHFQLPQLEDGNHTLTIKAWDVANNSTQVILQFQVINKTTLTLTHVLNYPNPFTTHTNFWFEHNHPGEDLNVMIQIFTVSGKLVKSIHRTINSPGNRSSEIDWDGRDDFGSKIARGVYIYSLRVRTMDGKTAQKLEKLLIL